MAAESKECPMRVKGARLPDLEGNAKKCACPSCPTFNECMIGNGERLYCARGSTHCPLNRLGCVCGECDVAIEYGLSSNYYCDGGPAKF
ncbi:MAG: DUF2769 domain-containing protein [Methanomassiliicoccus sp.]|nr:DUF2769 domain-containing protein [Methanomassiliicoccus sp.]